ALAPLPLRFDVLGAPDPDRPAAAADPEVRQRQLFAALRRLLQAASRREPRVSLVDDLHWIDEASEAFVAEWGGTLAGAHDLVVVNFRPGYGSDWLRRANRRQPALLPLPRDTTAEVHHELLGPEPLLPALVERI